MNDKQYAAILWVVQRKILQDLLWHLPYLELREIVFKLANALYKATGKRFYDQPFMPAINITDRG